MNIFSIWQIDYIWIWWSEDC